MTLGFKEGNVVIPSPVPNAKLPMRPRFRLARVITVALLISVGGVLALVLWFIRPWIHGIGPWFNPITSVSAGQDLRTKNLRKVDLRGQADLLLALRYNLETRWPAADRLPAGISPGQLLTNAMDPGLGVRDLHREGITGRGVHVAIIDYSIEGLHPEYAEQIVEIHRIAGAHSPTMHGPAVASLLAGKNCGTAPGARVHFIAVPDGVADARHDADAVLWVIERNKSLPALEKIRLISLSGAPSGRAAWPYKNQHLYDAAAEQAEAAGILVIDGTEHRAFVGPCNLDPENRQDPAKCRPLLARGKPSYFEGRILAPTGPRTTAEEYSVGKYGYQFCGMQKQTFLSAGSSWSIPYCAGVIALGLQLRPEMTSLEMKEILFRTAYVLPGEQKIIDPKAFIDAVKHAKAADQSTF